MLYDRTNEAALLKSKWNVWDKLWLGWKHFLYFFCPPGDPNDVCLYCFLTRIFFVGAFLGGFVMYWIMRLT